MIDLVDKIAHLSPITQLYLAANWSSNRLRLVSSAIDYIRQQEREQAPQVLDVDQALKLAKEIECASERLFAIAQKAKDDIERLQDIDRLK